MDISQKKTLYLISSIAALAGILFGFDTGVISGAILFINRDFNLSHQQTELVVSSVLLGAFLGAAMSGRLCDIIGRKRIIIITALIFIAGTLLTAFTPNLSYLVVGRITLGVAIGIASFAAPLYLAEISPRKKRGMLVSLNQLAITLGILASYLVDYYFTADAAWRMMLLTGVVPALLLLLGMCFLPESPRFLLLHGKENKARGILQRIRTQHEIDSEIHSIQKNAHTHWHWRDMFSNIKLTKIVFIGMLLATFQQITGINTIIYYAPTIFKLAGFDTSHAILVTSLVGLTNVIFTIIALPLIDHLGRRNLLFIGLSGMIVSLMMLGFAFSQPELMQSFRYLALLSMLIYIACFAVSLGPIVFVVISEIFPLAVRGLGMSLAMGANWASNMLVAYTFLSLIHLVGPTYTFYLFAMISLITILFVYHFIPETKGCSLEQIEKSLKQGLKCRDLGLPINKPKQIFKGV